MTPLAPDFLDRPIAHRGLHDLSRGRPENSLAAAEAACAAGYGIELDLQISRDGVPMVFHDDMLERLAGDIGALRDRNAAELERMALLGTLERIPSLATFLASVQGRAPLLVEVKDQPGPDPQTACEHLVEAMLFAMAGYRGPVAIMSFNPFVARYGSSLRPDLAWGVTTGQGAPLWPFHPDLEASTFGGGFDPRHFGASFVSQGLRETRAPWLAALARDGMPVLAWTVRSPAEEAEARRFAANITFEGYEPALPALQA